jgi:hypothetical protein
MTAMKTLLASLLLLAPLAAQAQLTALPGWDDSLFADTIDWSTFGTPKAEVFYPAPISTTRGNRGSFSSDNRVFLVREGNGWSGGWEKDENLLWVYWSELAVKLQEPVTGIGFRFQPGYGNTSTIEGQGFLTNFGVSVDIYSRGNRLDQYGQSYAIADQNPAFAGGFIGFTSAVPFDSFTIMGDGYVVGEIGLIPAIVGNPIPPQQPTIPEPSGLGLLGSAVVGGLLLRRQRRLS